MSLGEKNSKISLMACLCLFLFGLQVPRVMYVSVLLLLSVVFLNWMKKQNMRNNYIASFLLLLAFVFSYYSKVISFGYLPPSAAMRYSFLIVAMYIIGLGLPDLTVDRRIQSTVRMLLSLTLGFLSFALLTTLKFYKFADIYDSEYLKSAPSFWTGGELINRPGLGALASLGMCLLPVVFTHTLTLKDESLKKKNLIFVLLAVISGFSINTILANRAPIFSFTIAMFVGILLNFVTSRKIPTKTLMAAGAITGVTFALYNSLNLGNLYVISRLLEEGVSTAGRSEAWMLMLSNLFTATEGGHTVRLGGLSYVHNLWLDVAWDAGIYSFSFLVLFHLSHALALGRILLTSRFATSSMVICCLFVSFFANFMQEPTMAASAIYFAGSCFFLGVVSSLGRANVL